MNHEDEAEIPNDGLPIPEVGRWGDTKYGLVALYDKLFSTGMKAKWDNRVYIDLYAGAGFARFRESQKIVYGSPLLALDVPNPFDRYIFCEADTGFLFALRQRVRRLFPRARVEFVEGDCNDRIDHICEAIPRHSRGHTVLSFCFVDPLDIGIRFSTLRALATARLVDFLILLAVYMDANRNYVHYVNPQSRKVDDFLDSTQWREQWQDAESRGVRFPRFLAEEYGERMKSLGYERTPLSKMKAVRSDDKNLPLYYLALFSRHPLAYKLWQQVLQYSDDQMSLGFDK